MAYIDKFIGALHSAGAECLELAPDSKITMGTNGRRHSVSSAPLTAVQLDRILGEIRPGDGNGVDGDGSRYDFSYTAPTGDVRVSVKKVGGAHRLLIRPVGEGPVLNAEDGHVDAATTPSSAAEPVERVRSGERVRAVETNSTARARIDALFRRMVEERCSDLHLSTGVPPLFRKDGEIVALSDEAPLTADEAREILLSIAPPHKREEFERRHDSDFAYEIPDVARFRCNLFMDRRGMGGVFRVIPSKILTVKDLGLTPEMVELCRLPAGLVLVTGPTGSGKSTTLAAMVDFINENRTDHVVTIEDPIEFVHANKKCLVNQREVGTHTEGFKVALRAALREDPDVVLVGEMRDLETVAIAIETAETGHLVFGTLHTRTAASTVDRIIDQFPAEQQNQIRNMLAESLKGVISQTLVKAKGGGRAAAMEFLLVTSAVANLIREGKTFQIPSVMQTGGGKGMQTMNGALLKLVKEGRVEPQVAYWAAVDKSELQASFKRHGIELPASVAGG